MLRRVVLVLGLLALPVAAVAAPSPSPVPAASAVTDQARNGGTIEGRLTMVDYNRNLVGLDANGRGHLTVLVMPSTSIQGKDATYHTLSDLKAGQRVQIDSSIADGKYVAQIIRIR